MRGNGNLRRQIFLVGFRYRFTSFKLRHSISGPPVVLPESNSGSPGATTTNLRLRRFSLRSQLCSLVESTKSAPPVILARSPFIFANFYFHFSISFMLFILFSCGRPFPFLALPSPTLILNFHEPYHSFFALRAPPSLLYAFPFLCVMHPTFFALRYQTGPPGLGRQWPLVR